MAKLDLNKHILDLAKRYYGTNNLASLKPYQLDKITNWATNTDPETQARQTGRKYSGNTYKKLGKIFN
tara:strand:- start:180 stop:383 length:204 start_codon:yes stop_codon:yes gene_type:complete